jgi:hypothetical protein
VSSAWRPLGAANELYSLGWWVGRTIPTPISSQAPLACGAPLSCPSSGCCTRGLGPRQSHHDSRSGGSPTRGGTQPARGPPINGAWGGCRSSGPVLRACWFTLEHRCAFGPEPADEEVMHVGRRVYVSNLAWRTSWQDLKDKCVTGATCWPACLISAFSEQAGTRIQGLSGGMASKLQSLGRSCERSCLHCSSRSSLFTFLGSPQACRFRECGNVVYSNVIKDEAGEARCGGAGAAAPTAQRRLPVGSLFPALPCASSPAVHSLTAFCVPAARACRPVEGLGHRGV